MFVSHQLLFDLMWHPKNPINCNPKNILTLEKQVQSNVFSSSMKFDEFVTRMIQTSLELIMQQ